MKPDLMNFTETYNLRAVKYLYSMSNENLIEILGAYKKEETFDDYSMVEKEAYVNTIKKHLTKLIKDDNPSVSKKYNYSKGRAFGRIYANEFGIQTLAKPFRELVLTSKSYDYDIKNAMPSILLYLANINKYDCPKLLEYIENREKVLEKHSITKIDVLKQIFSDRTSKAITGWLKQFSKEIVELRNKINVMYKDYAIPSQHTKNPQGSALFGVLMYYENMILQQVMKKVVKKKGDVISVPFFDGFISNCELDIKFLNKITDDYNVEWVLKPFDNIIKIPDDFDENSITIVDMYKEVKIEFEKNVFFNEDITMFNRVSYTYDNQLDLKQISEANLITHYRPVKFLNDEGKKAQFIMEWLCDETRRTYKGTTFEPYLKLDPCENTEWFNTFRGFKCKLNTKYDIKTLGWFRDYISNLCNNSPDMIEYVINIISMKIQKPNVLMGVILVFVGLQGTGKSLFHLLLEKLLGTEYCYSTSDLNHCFGNFNSTAIKNKLILTLEEVEDQGGRTFEQQLKDITTRTTHNLNEKHQKQEQQTNYLLPIIVSNNHFPFKNVPNSRRPVYIETSFEEKHNADYWKNLVAHLHNEDGMNDLFSYLAYRDITTFDPKKRVISEIYKETELTFVLPEWRWLSEVLQTIQTNENFKQSDTNKTKGFVIKRGTFLSLINDYREAVDDKPTTQAALKHFRIEAGIKELSSFKGGWKQPFLIPADFSKEDKFEELTLRIKEHIPNYDEIENTVKQELNKTDECMIDDSDEDRSDEDNDVISITGTDNNKTTKLKINKKKLLGDE